MAKKHKPSHPETKDLEEYTGALRSLTDLLRKVLAKQISEQVESWAVGKAEKAQTDAERSASLDALKTWQTAMADLDELLRHMPHYLIVMVDLAYCESQPGMPEMPEALQSLLRLYHRLHVSTLVEKTKEASRGDKN